MAISDKMSRYRRVDRDAPYAWVPWKFSRIPE